MHQRTKICHIPTSWHVDMLGSGIAMWQICCRIVVSLSVGGVVQHVRKAGVRSGVWAFVDTENGPPNAINLLITSLISLKQ